MYSFPETILTHVFRDIRTVTDNHGYKVLVRTGQSRYHWGTCVREEFINPVTRCRKVISATWHHSRGSVTHRSLACQTDRSNMKVLTRTKNKPNLSVNKSVGDDSTDVNTLRDTSTSTEPLSIEGQIEPVRKSSKSQAIQADLPQESFLNHKI